MSDIIAWHFAANTLRDGSPLPDAGVTLPEIPDPIPCERGYHGSERAIDAIAYAPGPFVARVRLHGVTVAHGDPIDKHAASLRTGITGYVDATDVLRQFARDCALDVLHLWDAPPVVREYLKTGREDLRPAAEAAAWASAEATARVAEAAARVAKNDRLADALMALFREGTP